MLRIICAICAVLCAWPAWADVAARVDAAFRGWATDVGARDAALTLWIDGTPVHDVHLGAARTDLPVELASLSKAVTASCVAALMEEGLLYAETTSRDVLGAGTRGVQVKGLLTHASGLAPDETQVLMAFWLNSGTDSTAVASQRALARPLGPDSAYFYNNENYAVLGEMIAAITGQSYAQACRQRVLAPAGSATARPSPATGNFLAFGGWQMSLQDYARFLNWSYGPEGVVGARAHRLPAAPVSEHVSYGMGMFQRPWGPGYHFWHFGALCFPGRLETGSYAVRWQSGVSIVASYDRCLTDAQTIALDAALVAAVFQ
ncbi:MAG: serine hydrolase domain-containing protein [Pseudomonadota bacterium]